MSWAGVLASGVIATAVMTVIMTASQILGLSRMSIPYILGAMMTASRDRALPIGFITHFFVGLLFAFFYALVFEVLGTATWWLGAGLGVVHGLVVFLGVMPALPGLHPRMASERQGPQPTRALEPPGLLALHYGHRTPIVGMTAHLVYGAILGAMYPLG